MQLKPAVETIAELIVILAQEGDSEILSIADQKIEQVGFAYNEKRVSAEKTETLDCAGGTDRARSGDIRRVRPGQEF